MARLYQFYATDSLYQFGGSNHYHIWHHMEASFGAGAFGGYSAVVESILVRVMDCHGTDMPNP